MKLVSIQTKGDDGAGCYAGLEIIISLTWFPLIHIPLFWPAFFMQQAAKDHDAACDLLDWSDVEIAYAQYLIVTQTFIDTCTASATTPTEERQAAAAAWATLQWGRIRYLACSAGYVF